MAGKEFAFIPQDQEHSLRKYQTDCGLFGVYYPGHDARLIGYRAGTDLQHRAEGAAGMYFSNGQEDDIVKNLGTVAVAFQEGRVFQNRDVLFGEKTPYIGVLHTRYPTSGGSNHLPNIQPMQLDGITLGHHGNLTNAAELREKMWDVPMGGKFPDNDSWLALNEIVRSNGSTLADKLVNAQKKFEGGWAFILSDGRQLVASRDPYGTRPLSVASLGSKKTPEGFMISVETAPFDNLGAYDYREILPGETVVIDESGIKTVDMSPKGEKSCIFEFVYMMSPRSEFMGQLVATARRRAGDLLWREHPIKPKESEKVIVMGVPDSGRQSALAYFQQAQEEFGTKFTYDEGLLANRYFGRNFIKASGERAANLKFYTIKELIRDKVIVIVDDSLVRGETTLDNVKKMLDDGAREVHVRIASPEIKHPCYWGVAFSRYGELIANKIANIADRERYLGVTSLGHLSLKGLFQAVGMTPEQARYAAERDNTKFCTHCFDGNGPEIKKHGIIELLEVQKATT